MNDRRVGLLLASVVGVAAIAFAVMRVGPVASPVNSGSSGAAGPSELPRSQEQFAAALEMLMRIQDEEISERRILAEQLDEMRSDIARLQQILGARVDAVRPNDAAIEPSANRGLQSPQDRLTAAGFTAAQIDAIRRKEAESQMQQIEMDDRARREGWVNTPRYFEEVNRLFDGGDTVRRDLGDDAYDRYLFASGRNNRIVVSSIIATSPAESAGFQAGDIITSYGGDKIFSSQQLTKLRSTGEKGTPVLVDVVRDGEMLQIAMPRGAMGVQTRPHRADPSGQGR